MVCRISPALAARVVLGGIIAIIGILSGHAGLYAGAGSWTTSSAVAPGGTLTVNETVPGVNIAASTPIATCSLSGLNTDFIVYTCDAFGPGIPAGTQMQQTFAAVGSTTLPPVVPVTVNYNANGPLPAAPATTSESSAACTRNLSSTPTDPYPSGNGYAAASFWDCRVTTNALTRALQTLTLSIAHKPYSDFAPGDIAISTAPATLGMCPRVGSGAPGGHPIPVTFPLYSHGPGTDIVIQYSCDRGASIPGGTSIHLFVFGEFDNSVNPTPQEDPSTITADVAIPATVAVPAPTSQSLFGPNPPELFTVDPASAPPGATVTLSGTDLREFALSFGGTPGAGSIIGPSGGTTVNFGTQAAADVSCDPSGKSCTATVPPADPGTVVTVTVTDSAGTSNGQLFGYLSPPPPGS